MARRKIKDEPVKIVIPKKQARFYGTPGIEPIGYKCDGIAIMRNRGESTEELRARCRNAVEWTDTSTQHSFIPLTI